MLTAKLCFRYKLGIVIVIVNNNGIYGGLDKETYEEVRSEGDIGNVLVEYTSYLFNFFIYLECYEYGMITMD